MRTSTLYLCTALASMSLLGTSFAGDDKVKRAEAYIQTRYAKLVKVYVKHDLKAYAQFFTPDLKVKLLDGTTLDLKGQLAFAKADMETITKLRSAKIEFHKSTLQGDTLTSEATEVWDYEHRDVKGEYGPKGKTYPVLFRQRGIYTHIKVDDGWVLKSLEYKTDPILTSGGKPLVPLTKTKK